MFKRESTSFIVKLNSRSQKPAENKEKNESSQSTQSSEKPKETKLKIDDVDLSKLDLLIHGDRPAQSAVLYEDKEILVIEEREVQAAQEHFLVIMKSRHTGSLDQVDPIILGKMML